MKNFWVKNEEEYTSTIVKFYKTKNGTNSELITITENSIYIVDGEIPSRKIS